MVTTSNVVELIAKVAVSNFCCVESERKGDEEFGEAERRGEPQCGMQGGFLRCFGSRIESRSKDCRILLRASSGIPRLRPCYCIFPKGALALTEILRGERKAKACPAAQKTLIRSILSRARNEDSAPTSLSEGMTRPDDSTYFSNMLSSVMFLRASRSTPSLFR
jgi:hypothetical protein